MSLPAFLLTAGQGTRLRPWTDSKAKPCLPFLGLPMMGFGYYLCQQAGITDYAFNLHHLPESVETTVSKALPHLKSPHFMDERNALLGSGGALWNARQFLETYPSFLVANGDEVLIPQKPDILRSFINEFQRTKPLAQLLVMDHPELLKSLKPVWVDVNNQVIAFGMEKPSQPCRPVHYTGYKIFSRDIFKWLPEGESNIFYEVLTEAIAKGEKVQVMPFENLQWFETGTIPKYFEAASACLQLLQQNQPYLKEVFRFFGKSLENYKIQQTPSAITCFPKGWTPPESLNCKGFVSFDKNVSVGESVTLNNVVVESGVKIPDHSQIENQILFPT